MISHEAVPYVCHICVKGSCKPIGQSMKGLYIVFNPTSQLFFLNEHGGGYYE